MLECNRFAIQEHRRVVSTVQSYDIRDAETGEVVGFARENIGGVSQALRWVVSKRLLPTTVEVREKPDDSLVFTLRRGWYLFRSRLEVRDSIDQLVGYFASRLFTRSRGFEVFDRAGKPFARVEGELFGLEYRFLDGDGKVELGRVSRSAREASGVVRSAFFSADDYYLEVNPDLTEQPLAKMLLLATALAVDLIYKSY